MMSILVDRLQPLLELAMRSQLKAVARPFFRTALHLVRLAHFHSLKLRRRPYFGPLHAAHQGSIDQHAYLLETVSLLPANPRILEVGTWAGGSALTWAEGIGKFRGGKGSVLCVDAWAPYDDESLYHPDDAIPTMNRSAKTGAILELFLHNVGCSPFGHLISHKVGRNREVLPQLPAESFDLIYIDGSHRYDDVVFDLGEAKRLIADGGIVCGDDLELQIGAVSTQEAREESTMEYTLNKRTGQAYHPGVTRAVHEHFETVSTWGSYYAVRKRGDAFENIVLPEARALPSHFH